MQQVLPVEQPSPTLLPKKPEEVAMVTWCRYTDLGPVSSTSWRVYIAECSILANRSHCHIHKHSFKQTPLTNTFRLEVYTHDDGQRRAEQGPPSASCTRTCLPRLSTLLFSTLYMPMSVPAHAQPALATTSAPLTRCRTRRLAARSLRPWAP